MAVSTGGLEAIAAKVWRAPEEERLGRADGRRGSSRSSVHGPGNHSHSRVGLCRRRRMPPACVCRWQRTIMRPARCRRVPDSPSTTATTTGLHRPSAEAVASAHRRITALKRVTLYLWGWLHWLLAGWLAGWAAAWRPAGPAHRSYLSGQPACVGQRAAQQEFDLGVGAAQLVASPPGEGVVDGWVQPQQDALTFAHRVTVPAVTGRGSRC